MIQQFTYTASPWGKSGAGWQIFQQSRKMPADVAKKLHEVYRYEEPKKPTGGESHPVQFVYLPENLGDGAILAQTAFTGMRWWGEPRPGDFFAHVLMLDKDAVVLSCRAGLNPVRLFMSPKLQSNFPADEDLKEKALRIFRKETAWEAPPELPEFQSLSDLPENPRLGFDSALDAIPEHAVRQLGALVCAIVRRTTGKAENPIVFDSGNKFSPFVMSLALDLIPPTWRARTWFAIHFTESALRRLPGADFLTFYGTDGTTTSDPDSGIASGVDFAQDQFNFIDRNDVRAFKKQLDLIGAEVSFDDYNGLVNCRRISSGETTDLAALRSATAFADRFPGLKNEIGKGLANSLATYSHASTADIPVEFHVLSAVAWFELGFTAFEGYAKRTCSICAQDLTLLDRMVAELKETTVCTAFLNEVVDGARKSEASAFVNRIVESKIPLEKIVSTRPENDLLRLAVGYRKILADIHSCRVIESFSIDAAMALRKINVLVAIAGSGIKDIVEVKKYLEYRQDLAGIRGVDAVLPTLGKYVKAGFPKDANPRKDILNRISASSVQDIVKLACVLDTLNLQGAELICERWSREQYDLKRLRDKVRSLESLEPEEPKRYGCILPLILCVIGIVIGFFLGRRFGSAKPERLPYEDYRPQHVIVEPDLIGESDNGKQPNTIMSPTANQVKIKADRKNDEAAQSMTNETSKAEVKANATKVD